MTKSALVRYALAALLVAGAAMLGVSLAREGAVAAGEQRAPAQASGVRPPAGPPMVEAVRPMVRHTRGDKLAWQAKLRRLELTAGGKALVAGPLDEAVVYDREGRPVVRVVAAGIKGKANERNFTIEGPVQAVAERGAILQASRVEWIDDAARLHCVGPVTARFRNALVTAPEADLYVEKDEVVAPRDVRMTVGKNLVLGQQLTYNIATESFELAKVRMILHAQEARQQLRELRR